MVECCNLSSRLSVAANYASIYWSPKIDLLLLYTSRAKRWMQIKFNLPSTKCIKLYSTLWLQTSFWNHPKKCWTFLRRVVEILNILKKILKSLQAPVHTILWKTSSLNWCYICSINMLRNGLLKKMFISWSMVDMGHMFSSTVLRFCASTFVSRRLK